MPSSDAVKPRRGGFAERSASRGRAGTLELASRAVRPTRSAAQASASRLHGVCVGECRAGFFNLIINNRVFSLSSALRGEGTRGLRH